MNDERELLLDSIDKLVIHRHDLALFLLGVSDVQAVVKSGSCAGRDFDGAGN